MSTKHKDDKASQVEPQICHTNNLATSSLPPPLDSNTIHFLHTHRHTHTQSVQQLFSPLRERLNICPEMETLSSSSTLESSWSRKQQQQAAGGKRTTLTHNCVARGSVKESERDEQNAQSSGAPKCPFRVLGSLKNYSVCLSSNFCLPLPLLTECPFNSPTPTPSPTPSSTPSLTPTPSAAQAASVPQRRSRVSGWPVACCRASAASRWLIGCVPHTVCVCMAVCELTNCCLSSLSLQCLVVCVRLLLATCCSMHLLIPDRTCVFIALRFVKCCNNPSCPSTCCHLKSSCHA